MSSDIQRWSKRRKAEVVMRLIRGESLDDVSRAAGVEISRLERWRDKAMHGLEEGLREREGDPIQAALDEANRRIGELSMEVELLREKARRSGAFWPGRSRK
jgi:transposase